MKPEVYIIVAIAAYAVGALLAFIGLGRRKSAPWPQLSVAVMGVLAQTLALGSHCASSATHYFTSPMEILWLLAWSVAVNYVVILWAWRIVGLGVIVLPLNVILLAASMLSQFPGPAPVGGLDRHPFYPPHVMTAFLGYGFFLTACAISILYLRAEWLLKHKLFGAVFRGIPSLERLERTAGRCVWAGFAFFSIALALGAYLANAHHVDGWFFRPKVLAAEITWMVFLVLLVGRASGRLVGRMAAQTALVGAALIALTIILGHPFQSPDDGPASPPATQEKVTP